MGARRCSLSLMKRTQPAWWIGCIFFSLHLSSCHAVPDQLTVPNVTVMQVIPVQTFPKSTAVASSRAIPQIQVEPLPELDGKLEVTSLSTGKYSSAIQFNALNINDNEESGLDQTSSILLHLKADGSIRMCRGWRLAEWHVGPNVHSIERIEEQFGYRGQWARKGAWIRIHLQLDNAICPHSNKYSHWIPKHSKQWELRCLPVRSKNLDSVNVETPMIICQRIGNPKEKGEDQPHLLTDFLPNPWIILGSVRGIRVWYSHRFIQGKRIFFKNHIHSSMMSLTAKGNLIAENTWEHSF
jgi:hypothetical protein